MTFVITQDDNCYCSTMEARGASKDLHHQQKGRHGGVAALDLIACQDEINYQSLLSPPS